MLHVCVYKYIYTVCVCVLPLFVRSFLSLYENPPTDAVPSDIANVILNIIVQRLFYNVILNIIMMQILIL